MSARPNLTPAQDGPVEIVRQRQTRAAQREQQPAADALDKASSALTNAFMEADAIQSELRFKLLPLLGLCEFASRAHHSLTNFKHLADHDPATRKRLDCYDEEWTANLDDEPALLIGEVLALARTACMEAATKLQVLTEKAGDARNECRAAQQGGGHG